MHLLSSQFYSRFAGWKKAREIQVEIEHDGIYLFTESH